MDRLHRWKLLSAECIRDSPTVRDGWSAATESGVRKKAARVIFEIAGPTVARSHRMGVGTAGMAMTLFVRFFSKKSMVKNHPFVISVACLFVAGKANDEPRSLKFLITEMLSRWYGWDNPGIVQLRDDPDGLPRLKDAVVDAEHVLLITVEFDLNVEILPHVIAQFLKYEHTKVHALTSLRTDVVQKLYVKWCNNIMKMESALVLQYDARTIAVVICHYLLKVGKDMNVPERGQDGKEWYEGYGVSVPACEEICSKIRSANKQAEKAAKSAKLTREDSSAYQSREGSPSKKMRLGHHQRECDVMQTSQQVSSQGPGDDDDNESLEEGEIR